MAISLSSLRSSRKIDPPRLLIYGAPGLGKTSLACEFPNPVIFDIEDSMPLGVDIQTFGQINSYDDVMAGLKELYTQPHDFKTVIIDTLDRFEPLVWQKACDDNKWKNIEDAGYGKGYVIADDYWEKIIAGFNALRKQKGMAVIYLSHSAVTQFDDPINGSYSRYDMRLHKRALSLIQGEVDAILFINNDATIKTEEHGFNKTTKHAEGGATRWIYTEGRPSFVAKNRHQMPERILYRKGQGASSLIPYLSGKMIAKQEGAKQEATLDLVAPATPAPALAPEFQSAEAVETSNQTEPQAA